jgi:formylglycine-generating enzyme
MACHRALPPTWCGLRRESSGWAPISTTWKGRRRTGRRLFYRSVTGDQPALPPFVAATGYRSVAERQPNPADYPGALPHMLKPGALVRICATSRRVELETGCLLAPSRRQGGCPTTRAGRVRGCRGLCSLGRQEIADRNEVGVCGARRARRRRVSLGRRVKYRRPPDGEYLTRRILCRTCVATASREPRRSAFPPNGYRLFGMAGNVWEWTTDWFDPGL